MSKRRAPLLATAVAAATLLLAGCGSQAPATSVAYGAQAAALRASGLAPQKGPSLTALIQQASALIKRDYPNSKLYEVSGNHGASAMVDAGDFDNWSFGALDDAAHPKNTVSVVYSNGHFSAATSHRGFHIGRRLSPVASKVGLRAAIVSLRQAGFNQTFQCVDLYKLINPKYTQAFYIFSSEQAIVTVGAEDGIVSQQVI